MAADERKTWKKKREQDEIKLMKYIHSLKKKENENRKQ